MQDKAGISVNKNDTNQGTLNGINKLRPNETASYMPMGLRNIESGGDLPLLADHVAHKRYE